jgi:hypothetical protein
MKVAAHSGKPGISAIAHMSPHGLGQGCVCVCLFVCVYIGVCVIPIVSQLTNMVDLSLSGLGNSKHTASPNYHDPWF